MEWDEANLVNDQDFCLPQSAKERVERSFMISVQQEGSRGSGDEEPHLAVPASKTLGQSLWQVGLVRSHRTQKNQVLSAFQKSSFTI